MVSVAFPTYGTPDDDKEKPKPLSPEAYVKALEKFAEETGEAENLEITIDVIPDVY